LPLVGVLQVSRIFRFNPMRRRLSNAVTEVGTQTPCKSLKRRPCCRETSGRNGAAARCDRKRKSITVAKIRKDAIFARSFKYVARMERSVIRDCREASIPPRISLRSIRAGYVRCHRRGASTSVDCEPLSGENHHHAIVGPCHAASLLSEKWRYLCSYGGPTDDWGLHEC